MGKTLYLHIGTPKTATTAIQMFCEENQEVLNKNGFSYPIMDFSYPHVQIRRNGHFLVGWMYLENGEEDKEKEEDLWNRGLERVHREFEKYPNVILSDEGIWHSSNGRKFPFWERLMQDAAEYGYRVKVIVYLRRQDGMANSWLSQQVKECWNPYACIKWESFQKKTRKVVLNYYGLLEKIAGITGKENIIVRVFERGGFKGKGNTIYSDFLEAIGLEYTDDFTISSEEANTSLTGNSQEILRVVNSVLPDDIPARALVRNAALECERLKDPQNDFVMFSEEEQEAFMARYEETNKAIAKEYLGQETPLFSSKVKKGERWTPDNCFMYEDIIRFFGSVIVQQQKHIEEIEASVKSMQESRIESIAAMTGNCDEEDFKENHQLLSEQIMNQQKEIQEALAQAKSVDALRDKLQSVRIENLNLKNELVDLKRELREVESMGPFGFRLRRKLRHITGQDKK